MASSIADSEPLYKLGAQLFLFRVPQTTTLTNFHTNLKSSVNTPEAQSLVKSVSSARLALHSALYSIANAKKDVPISQLEETLVKV